MYRSLLFPLSVPLCSAEMENDATTAHPGASHSSGLQQEGGLQCCSGVWGVMRGGAHGSAACIVHWDT